jgi:hypothetical protein
MLFQRFYRCAPCAALVLLGACSHTPGPGDIPPGANFTTHILADSTKLFVYSTPQRGGREHRSMRGGGAEREGGDMEQQRPRDNRRASQNGLQAMLTENNYCREGYVVLEQYETRNQYVIRGECRDAATADDRARFDHGS